jgi:hypothetical protein
MTAANTYVSPDGKHRTCRKCRSSNASKSQQRPEYKAWVRGYSRAYHAAHRDKQYYKKRRTEMLAWVKDIRAGLSCVTCGENDSACLDFHHRDPNGKDFHVMTKARLGISKDRVLAEIAKCDVLCSNCHRKLHAAERARVTDIPGVGPERIGETGTPALPTAH